MSLDSAPDARSDVARTPYTPPADDDAPLDPIEEALVRAFVAILLPKLREKFAIDPPKD